MRWMALALVLGGCGGWVETSPAMFGPYADRSEPQLFDEVRQRVQARGYRPIDADPALGHFAVRSRARGPEGHVVFRFRFYRGGWIGTEVGGAGVRRTNEGRLRMPDAIFDEYAELVVELMGRRREE